ncbi:agmatine deiminase family protein [Aestuariicoccus sp. MJ-SS9]|uniref:agmatine deiminase family protein n=1 Tax=Aestuariicoccus sp. MJ-SS9 TaxID=3079855 RepID=UPI002911DABE|nr:agmatine deiminase family protein [Aestuariicoccus sp. MJ-SS9]MDU8911800.1 agmatine deiminase family protein [Aestuariicoccus sp. MJ-SS9]
MRNVLRAGPPARRVILPDDALPDAVCVPHWVFDIRDSLETLAAALSRETGVILIGPDAALAERFIGSCELPDHFGHVTGMFDTPWLRDHAPIPLVEDGALRFVLPRQRADERPHDSALFATILAAAPARSAMHIAAGNLVPGPDGLAVSTADLLVQNGFVHVDQAAPTARQLGIHDWLFLDAFPDDPSGHTDSMLRFLGPDLCAIAWRTDTPAARRICREMAQSLCALRPAMTILKLPVAATRGDFCSPLNWIQVGRVLFLPDFGACALEPVTAPLAAAGFDCRPVPCPTRGLGGALHCLTASVVTQGGAASR